MHAIYSLSLGYLLGSLSPAALLSKLKNVNLKEEGTKNLGATNTMLVLGKASGLIVMVFDIAKSYFSYKIARALFPQLALAGLLASIGAILGHIFPVFLKFQGGKGLAAFGGLVLAQDPMAFAMLLSFGCVLVLIFNYGVALPISAAVLFPILEYFRSDSMGIVLLAAVASGIIIAMHWSNVEKAKTGNDIHVREYLKNSFFKRKKK